MFKKAKEYIRRKGLEFLTKGEISEITSTKDLVKKYPSVFKEHAPGLVFIDGSPSKPEKGDSLIVGTFSLALNGYDLGTTEGGVHIWKKDGFFFIRVKLRDLTLDKIAALFNLKLTEDGDSACSKDSDESEDFSLTVCGPGPGCGCRSIHFEKVEVQDVGEYSIKKDFPVELEVVFKSKGTCCFADLCDIIDSSEGRKPLEINVDPISLNTEGAE